MEKNEAKVTSCFDEDGAEWIKVTPYIGKTGEILMAMKTYFILLMPDKEVLHVPNECAELVLNYGKPAINIDIEP